MIEKLYLAEEVPAETISFEEIVIPNGVKAKVINFYGSAGFSLNTAIRIDWDGTPLWSIKGEQSMPDEAVEVTEVMGDGAKKFRLVLDNASLGPAFLSGLAVIELEQ